MHNFWQKIKNFRLFSKNSMPAYTVSSSYKQFFLYFIVFIFSYSCFYGYMKLNNVIQEKSQQIVAELNKRNIFIQNIEYSLIQQKVLLTNVSYKTKENILINNAEIEVLLWKKGLGINLDLFDGTMQGTICIDSIFNLKNLIVDININALAIKKMLALYPNPYIASLGTVTKGTVNTKLHTIIPMQQNRPLIHESNGNIELFVNDSSIKHNIPILKNDTISAINLKGEATWEKQDLKGFHIKANSSVINADFSGTAYINYFQLLATNINVDALVKIDKKDINETFTPKNTLKAINKYGQVKMKITGSLGRPNVNIL